MRSDATHSACGRDRTKGAAVLILLGAVTPAAQPGRPDLSKVTVLKDIEYVPGGHDRQKLDLYLPKETPADSKKPLIAWVHGGAIQENKDRVRRANPITYVTKDDPPFLIVHGDKDPLVPHNQSELLRDALTKAGVNVTFYTVEGGGHGGFKDFQVNVLVTEFFSKHLQR